MLTKDEGERLFNWIQKILILHDPELREYTIKKAVKEYTEQPDVPEESSGLINLVSNPFTVNDLAYKLNEIIETVNLITANGDNNNE